MKAAEHMQRHGNTMSMLVMGAIGSNAADAADAIDACFAVVYGERGAFGLALRGFGWQPTQ